MKWLRYALVIATALAAVSAAPGGEQQMQQKEQPPADPQKDAPGQDALRRMFTDLAAENVKLRKDVMDLRADNDALKQKLQESERQLRQLRANHGALAVPPQPPQGQPNGNVPRNWRPFQFNGATYYVVPLKAEQDGRTTGANSPIEVEPAK